MADDSMFDVARREADLGAVAERYAKLRGPSHDRRSHCPFCDPQGAVKGGGTAFQVNLSKKRWRTFCCEKYGDVVDLYAVMERRTPVEAVRDLVGGAALPAPSKPRAAKREKAPEGPSASDRIAVELWREAGAFAGSIGERYLLEGRAIPAEVVAAASANLRFHPRAKRSWDKAARRWSHAPAILNLVVVAGEDGAACATGGVHATYLSADGRAKADGDDAKKMWGPQHLDGRPGGAWLIGPGGSGPVAIAEGYENALSVAAMSFLRHGVIPRTCAALSLGRLQGGMKRGADDLIDLHDVRPDPERPAFTWPGVGHVMIAIDRDMKRVRVQGRTPRGKPCSYWLDAEARARICARLTEAVWRAAGAEPVCIWPKPGHDLNDDLRAQRAPRTPSQQCVA